MLKTSLACILLIAPVMAGATSVLEFDTRESERVGKLIVAVQNGMVRVDEGSGNWMLYDSRKNTVFVIDTRQQAYLAIDREEAQRYAQTLSLARQGIELQLRRATPEQRAQVEKWLGKGETPAPMKYVSTKTSRKVNGYRCTAGRLERDGAAIEEVCVASAADIGMSAQDYATVRSMYKLMSEVQEADAPGIMPNFSVLDGVPIQVGKSEGDLQAVAKVTHEQLPAERFRIPKDYRQDDLTGAAVRMLK